MACQGFQGQRGPSCMALTNRPLVLCSITTESVARATSRSGSLGPGALATPHAADVCNSGAALPGSAGLYRTRQEEALSGPLGLAQPAGRAARKWSLSLSQGLGLLISPAGIPHAHLITWARQQHGCLWSSVTPSSHLLPQAFSSPHPPWLQPQAQLRLPPEPSLDHTPTSCLDTRPPIPKVASVDPAFTSRIPP